MANYLARGSADWNEIERRFKGSYDRLYDRFLYSAEDILDSNPDWKAKYDRAQFTICLRNLVSSLYLQRPERVKPSETVRNTSGIMPPGPQVTPAGAEHLASDARVWKTPTHQIEWVDSQDNQDIRVTSYQLLLPGGTNKNYNIRVERGGRVLTNEYTVPEEFMNPRLLLMGHKKLNGQPFYDEGHAKVVALNEHIKKMRGGKSDEPVKYVYRIPLQITCEEQSAETEAPKPIYSGVFKEAIVGDQVYQNKVKILAVELIAERKNFKTQDVQEEEIDLEEVSGSPAPPRQPAPRRQPTPPRQSANGGRQPATDGRAGTQPARGRQPGGRQPGRGTAGGGGDPRRSGGGTRRSGGGQSGAGGPPGGGGTRRSGSRQSGAESPPSPGSPAASGYPNRVHMVARLGRLLVARLGILVIILCLRMVVRPQQRGILIS